MNSALRWVHATGDYVIGGLLLMGPRLFGFSDDPWASMITHAFGAVLIGCNLFTNYELGLYRRISPTARLLTDAALGGLLIASPWIFGFADVTRVPHLVIGTVAASRSCLYGLTLLFTDGFALQKKRRKAHS